MKTAPKDPRLESIKTIKQMIATGATTQADLCRAVYGNAGASARVSVARWMDGVMPSEKNHGKILKHIAAVVTRIKRMSKASW